MKSLLIAWFAIKALQLTNANSYNVQRFTLLMRLLFFQTKKSFFYFALFLLFCLTNQSTTRKLKQKINDSINSSWLLSHFSFEELRHQFTHHTVRFVLKKEVFVNRLSTHIHTHKSTQSAITDADFDNSTLFVCFFSTSGLLVIFYDNNTNI